MGKASHVLIAIALLSSVSTLGLLAQEHSAHATPPHTLPIEANAAGKILHYPSTSDTPHVHPPHVDPLLVDRLHDDRWHDDTVTEAGFYYADTGYSSVFDTAPWPVALPFTYYPQGPVTEDGAGIYQCLVPPDPIEACFLTPPPCYLGQFYVEGVALDRRSNLERMSLFFDSTGAEVLNTGDFDLETEAGVRLGFWLCDPCGIDWNFDYFSVQNYQSTIGRTDAAGLTNQFFGFTDVPVTTLTAEYESNLDSLEFTVRVRQWRRLVPLVGIRFVQVEEAFNSLQGDPALRAGSFSGTDNELFGMQFGFQALLCEHNFCRLETTIKAGPYYNDIDVDAAVTPSGGAQQTVTLDHGALAFVGDARVTLVCRLGPRSNFRIGYQALMIDGVALGPNQNNNLSFTTNLNSVDLSGILYQGGNIGFDVTW